MSKVKYTTTTQAAAELGRSDGRIRSLCRLHGLGVKVARNSRLLTPADMRRLKAIVDGFEKSSK